MFNVLAAVAFGINKICFLIMPRLHLIYIGKENNKSYQRHLKILEIMEQLFNIIFI